MANSSWRLFYEKLEEIYLELQQCNCLFSLNEPFNAVGNPSGKYRGVFQLNEQETAKFEQLLLDGKRLYDTASDGKGKGLPINFPKFVQDKSIFKMQIHINKAHLSQNYDSGMLKVASVDKMFLPEYGESIRKQIDENRLALLQAQEDLEKLGYDVLIEDIDLYDIMYINVERLCELYQCKSVQHRIDTGRQIRANYFSRDDDDNITKSKLQSIGILLIPFDQCIQVLHSHDRKIRTDAIYTKRHPTEIILEEIPEQLRIGRLYRRE